VCHEFGRPLQVEKVELGEATEGEVTVDVGACGVCHSDIAYMDGAWGGDLPAVYGHEVAGVVTHIGPGVEGIRAGDSAVVTLVRSCGRCYFCLHGDATQCVGTFPIDSPGPLRGLGGRIKQAMRVGGFAEAVTVHPSQVVRIDPDIPKASACLLACAVATGYGAVHNTARVTAGASVAVIGAGGVGLNAIQGAVLAGAAPVIALDLSETRLLAAREFGAHELVDSKDAAVEKVRALTGGRGADYTFICVGAAPAVQQGIEMTRRGGTAVVVGIPPTGVTAPIDLGLVADSGLHLLGSKMGSIRPQVDIPAMVALYREGRLKLDELVTTTFPLDRINEAITLSRRGEGLRNVIVM
jgi:Zn-dependent alcohol dehydrogenase